MPVKRRKPINKVVKDMATASRGVLRASMFGIEQGLFRVMYRGLEATSADELPTYQFGQDASEAKRRLEISVTALGYEAIIWEDADTALAAAPEGPAIDSAPCSNRLTAAPRFEGLGRFFVPTLPLGGLLGATRSSLASMERGHLLSGASAVAPCSWSGTLAPCFPALRRTTPNVVAEGGEQRNCALPRR
jgi:hypothetical protein